jgi:hypothetical protein
MLFNHLTVKELNEEYNDTIRVYLKTCDVYYKDILLIMSKELTARKENE